MTFRGWFRWFARSSFRLWKNLGSGRMGVSNKDIFAIVDFVFCVGGLLLLPLFLKPGRKSPKWRPFIESYCYEVNIALEEKAKKKTKKEKAKEEKVKKEKVKEEKLKEEKLKEEKTKEEKTKEEKTKEEKAGDVTGLSSEKGLSLSGLEESSTKINADATCIVEPVVALVTVGSTENDESVPKSTPKNPNDRYIRKRMIIAGSSHSDKVVLEQLNIGAYLDIAAEPDNPYDKTAVMLLFQNKKVGYISKEDKLLYNAALNLGRKVYGVITNVICDKERKTYEFETWYDSQ